jgi:sec-independent protein translocase protein TatB
MFDVGFWELLVIGIVALLVIGPERLPGVTRTVGAWVGKAKRFVSTVKADIDKELRTEDLKRILKEQEESIASHKIIDETIGDVQSDIKQLDTETQAALRDTDKTNN